MNKTVYNILTHIPVVNVIVRMKCNYLGFMCSPFLEDWMNNSEYDVLKDWLEANPNQILSPKKAKELMAKSKNK